METRERFLDAVRALAVVRVMVWHAFGFAAITYFVSAVPAMFFVTGSLLARSLDRHGYVATLRDRTRRLLIPLWLFATVAFAATSCARACAAVACADRICASKVATVAFCVSTLAAA